VYPIAFIEFCKDGDGKVTREGPRREKEEQAAQDAWTVGFLGEHLPDLAYLGLAEARTRV
jgi:hypothetical protein